MTAYSDTTAHILGDYCVQSSWMAAEKTKHSIPAAAHAITYTACFLPVTRSWRTLAVIGTTHFAIDRWRLVQYPAYLKNQLAPERYRYSWARARKGTGYEVRNPVWLSVMLTIIVDNSLHIWINRWALKRFGDTQ